MALHKPAGLRQDIHTGSRRATALIYSTWEFRHFTRVGISVADVFIGSLFPQAEPDQSCRTLQLRLRGNFPQFSSAGADFDHEHIDPEESALHITCSHANACMITVSPIFYSSIFTTLQTAALAWSRSPFPHTSVAMLAYWRKWLYSRYHRLLCFSSAPYGVENDLCGRLPRSNTFMQISYQAQLQAPLQPLTCLLTNRVTLAPARMDNVGFLFPNCSNELLSLRC